MKWFFRAMSVVFALLIVAGGIGYGVKWATTQWTRYGCFTVNYVDLRGGYAPNPSIYTSMGRIDNEADGNITSGEIGKWRAGDSYCGPITYGNGQFDPYVLFSPRVNTTHAVPMDPNAPTNVGDAP